DLGDTGCCSKTCHCSQNERKACREGFRQSCGKIWRACCFKSCCVKVRWCRRRESRVVGEALFFSARKAFRAALAGKDSCRRAVQERIAESNQSRRSGIRGDGPAI